MKPATYTFSFLALLLLLLAEAGCAGTAGIGNPSGGTTIPSSPVGLSAVAGNAQVALTWNASSGATLYTLQRSITTGGPYTNVSSQSGTSFTDSGLTNGTKYFYVVAASNSAGQSANSAEVSATPTLSAPATPAGLAAAAGNAQVTLTWTPSTGATTYHVKRSTVSGAETQIAAPTSNTFTDTGVTNGTKYFYVVFRREFRGRKLQLK